MARFCNKCGNQVGPGEKFCGKCGNALDTQPEMTIQTNPIPVNAPIVSGGMGGAMRGYKMPKVKKSLAMGIGIGVLLVVLFVIVGVSVKMGKKYYFDTESGDESESEVVVSSGSGTKKNHKYSTAIIYDNTYSGVNIGSSKDAYALIEKDSVSQKGQCPAEIKKVEEEIISKYGITAVNLCEMDVEFAKELGNVFKKIYDEYPSVRGYITNLSLVNATMSNNYIAAFMPIFTFASSDTASTYPWVIKTQVLLNSSYFLNPDKLQSSVTSGSASGHFPKNATIYSPVAHELGHYLSFLAMMKHYDMRSLLLINSGNVEALYKLYDDFAKGDFSLSMIKEAYENYKRDTHENIGFDEWRGTISQYALAKDNNGDYIYDETIAESFHDVYLNGDKASPASKYVVAVLKERLGK